MGREVAHRRKAQACDVPSHPLSENETGIHPIAGWMPFKMSRGSNLF